MGKPSVYLEILGPVKDKPIKQGRKKITILFFSQPEISVALATKENSYSVATLTLKFGLMKLISLIEGN